MVSGDIYKVPSTVGHIVEEIITAANIECLHHVLCVC